MNQISLREFQLHASKYLDKLPLVLTQYNIPIVVVSKVDHEVTYTKSVNTPILESIPQKKTGHCEASLCKSMEGVLVKGKGYSEEGEVKTEKYLCKFHIAMAKRQGEEIQILD